MHAVQLHEGPDHVFIRFLKTKMFSLFLMFVGKQFQILGPRCLSESVPYFLVLIVLAKFLLLFGVQIMFESEHFVHVGWIEVVNCFKKYQSNI